MASGSIHGPCTLARNTLGPHVTQNREWMHFLPSYCTVSFSPAISSTPFTTTGAGGLPFARAEVGAPAVALRVAGEAVARFGAASVGAAAEEGAAALSAAAKPRSPRLARSA